MRKKVVGLWMALLLCLSSAIFLADSATAAAKTSADFIDLENLDAATKAKFDTLISAGIFDGVDDGAFGLKDRMNRAQFAKVAALIFNLKVDTGLKTSSFSDVKADDPANGYALPYIEAVKAAGITDGYGEGIFNPAGEVTKEQLAAFLVRGLGRENEAKATPGVNDATVSDWAKGYVAVALERKIMNNGDDGMFGGKDNATREQLVLSSYETVLTQYETSVSDRNEEQDADSESAEHQRSPLEEAFRLIDQTNRETERREEERRRLEEERQRIPVYTPPYNPPPATKLTLDAPTALPAGGAVDSGTQVALQGMPADAAVYYTTDLSEPTTSSMLYTEPITITSSTTIKAIAVHPEADTSSVARFDYTVTMPIVMPDSISPMTEGELYSGSVAKLSGGTGTVTYAVTNGTLPAGLTLNPDTGAITGTPSVSGAYSFTITATDSATPSATATMPYTDAIAPALSIVALELINAASASGDWTGVTETTFADAGVAGVSSENLVGIQIILQDYDYPATALPKTMLQIQAIIDEIINVAAIYDYLNPFGFGSGKPTVEVFTLAGITGVDASNLDAILDELSWAYQDSRSNPFGTPMSTKQHIQDVVDLYLSL